jgi:hypothetical protein
MEGSASAGSESAGAGASEPNGSTGRSSDVERERLHWEWWKAG